MRKIGLRHALAQTKGRIALWHSETVPRTDHLADITTEYPISEGRPQTVWYLAFQFNSQIRNTAAGIDGSIGQDALGWTSLDAAGTGPALIRGKRWIGFKLKIKQDLCQEKV